ncbi:MAG: DUF4065 domain-containing protein [Lachnospiraceae bacterium]|nr:DUF4065 domain-containing protein [Lachnospiraceae bacterium]
MYSALDLSKYIVSKCIKENHPISNLQLQKILYYIQKEFLKNGCFAFGDDIEAWQFGPVVPNVYYHYCGFGAMAISNSRDNYTIKSDDAAIVDDIVEKKRLLDPWTMVSETHKPNGAWAQIYNKNGVRNHKVIPPDLIKAVG